MSFTTHFSILEGLKNNSNVSWERFYHFYMPLIRMHGKDCGITEQDLDDLVQNVLISINTIISGFRYNPAIGRFRDYLRKIIQARSADLLRSLYKNEFVPLTETMDGPVLDQQFEEEWHDYIQSSSLELLKKEINILHYQIFLMLDMQNRSIKEVSKLYNLPESTVYSIRQRTETKLHDIAESLDA